MEKGAAAPDKQHSDSGSKQAATGRLHIDHLDLRILRHLLLNGRLSFRQLSEELHVSTTTVAARVARLQAQRVITGHTTLVDFQKLGYDLTVITEIHVSKGKLVEVEREIARLANVVAVYDVTGEIDVVVISKCKDREELSHFTKSLLAMPHVERTNSHVVLTTVKEDFRLPV